MQQDTRADEEIRKRVAIRAYEIYLDRGGQHGRDIDDWLQAEAELLAEKKQEQLRTSGRTTPRRPRG
ncbi:MAG TPA: DUF2934 domain-containing protein [Terriglobia bacterium]|nr:DUF2934 domain-containing protein [Terriglobia bacterium]